MASQSSSPNVSGPLAGMFTTAAQQAIIAEEAADLLTQEQNIERATIAAAAATAAAAAAEVEATASALLGSVGLPVQHGSAERVSPEAAAQEETGPADMQEPVGPQTRRSSPTRASTPSGAVPRAARGGTAGKSPPATQADLRAVQVELALLIAGHTTEIAQLQTMTGAHQATVVGASSDMDEMRVQISSYSDAMTASEERLIAMMSPLMDETHATAERLTELDLQMKAMRIELRQRPSPQQYDVHTPSHPGRTVGADDPWQPRPEAGRTQAPRRKPSPGRLIKYAISGSRVALICVLCLVSTKMSLTSTEKCDDGDTFCRAILGTWLRAFVVTFASLPLPREKPSTPFATLALHALVGELLLGSPGRVSHFQL